MGAKPWPGETWLEGRNHSGARFFSFFFLKKKEEEEKKEKKTETEILPPSPRPGHKVFIRLLFSND